MQPAIGVVVYQSQHLVDGLLVALSRRLRQRDLRLAGLVQHNEDDACTACGHMALEDLATGRLVPISEQRGRGARGCRLDAQGLATSAGLAAAAIGSDRVDLVILNKFGKAEAEGRGLRDEFGLAVGRGLPTLTAVGEALLPAWRSFAGEDWQVLEPSLEALEAWCLAQVADEARAAERITGGITW
ncbi:Protein of unknown function (DUF2478) [Chelatococcus sambhunathii]|uniref:DUF2478 domain-containing protein n=1 Tax=Chelatococcus sambhunathii TaxID=363953 RepID=A0ABP2A8X3_9HYPH|nr:MULTISPECIES: DUF2478 domain-containing protein [Chelatococcus]CUA89361.1 Protein of unknown function (DUF2478) [Chelatococcus sambhunathii]